MPSSVFTTLNAEKNRGSSFWYW